MYLIPATEMLTSNCIELNIPVPKDGSYLSSVLPQQQLQQKATYIKLTFVGKSKENKLWVHLILFVFEIEVAICNQRKVTL